MPASNGLPRNLLVARFSALGDVAMTIPVVYSACRCNPDTRFIFITKPVQESLFINPPENLVACGDSSRSFAHNTRSTPLPTFTACCVHFSCAQCVRCTA